MSQSNNTSSDNISIVYMVAGMSSRFGGNPKQFANVGPNNETLIEYSLNQALSCPFTNIVFIVGNTTESLFKEMFGKSYTYGSTTTPIKYVKQDFDPVFRDRPWGTTDSIASLYGVINNPFILCNGDDIYGVDTFKLCFKNLIKYKSNLTVGYNLASTLPDTGTVNRGIFKVKDNFVIDIQERFNIHKSKLSPSDLNSLASTNIFALQPYILKYLHDDVTYFKSKHSSDRKIECLLPVSLCKLIKNNLIEIRLYSSIDEHLGITNPDDQILLKQKLLKQKQQI